MPSRDITEDIVASRTGGPSALAALSLAFPGARLHLPLVTLDGVRNHPDTALEMRERLPLHWVRLDNGERALPIFSKLSLCRECAGELAWQTDGRAIKTLALSGATALSFLAELLVDLDIDRVILNPLTRAELHLARTDVEAIAEARPRSSLWFYTRGGRMKQPVEIEGGSLIDSFLTRADRALKRLADGALDSDEDAGLAEILQTSEMLGSLPDDPLGSLSAEIYRLLLRDPVEEMDLTITKTEDGISVRAEPPPSRAFLASVESAAETHLADHAGDVEVCFRINGWSIVASSSSSVVKSATRDPARKKGQSRVFDYIPLEPEELPDD